MTRLVVLVLVLAACSDDGKPVPPRPPSRAPATRIVPTDAAPPAFVGVITAAESVDLAPRFDGVLAAVHVRPGDRVGANQIVAEMDRKAMQEELRAAQASLAAAQAAAKQADVDVEDARRRHALETKAVADGVSPRAVAEEAALAVKRAEAAAQRAASTVAAEASHVQTARDHLADTALRARFAGTVALRFKDAGATVGPSTPIVRIVGHGGEAASRLRFAVPPEQARGLAVGATLQATIDTLPAPVAATIRQISPALDPASGMILVEADLAVDAELAVQLRPGLAAIVR